jgi:alkyl hydroperoxide reductase subunit AhpC
MTLQTEQPRAAYIAPSIPALKANCLSYVEVLAQSVSVIAPSTVPATVLGLISAAAGSGTWLRFLIGMLGLVLNGDEGKIKFHDWIGDSWAVLFSHPNDFTPVCTTELGYMAKIKSEFDRRNVRIIGLSVDPLDRHAGWVSDIKETEGHAPNYPMIAHVDYNVSELYGMLPAPVSGDPTKRTGADNQTVRNVFVIGPDKKIKLIWSIP